MAGGRLPNPDLPQRRCHRSANCNRHWAPPQKTAAFSRLNNQRRLSHLSRVHAQRRLRVRHSRQQQPGVGVRRPVQHILCHPCLYNSPRVHHHNPLRDIAGTRNVVRDIKERNFLLRAYSSHRCAVVCGAEHHERHGQQVDGRDRQPDRTRPLSLHHEVEAGEAKRRDDRS